jgi:hypothetical protein
LVNDASNRVEQAMRDDRWGGAVTARKLSEAEVRRIVRASLEATIFLNDPEDIPDDAPRNFRKLRDGSFNMEEAIDAIVADMKQRGELE